MKLIEAKRFVNDQTFEPCLRITFDLSIEGYMDGKSILSTEEFIKLLGTEVNTLICEAHKSVQGT